MSLDRDSARVSAAPSPVRCHRRSGRRSSAEVIANITRKLEEELGSSIRNRRQARRADHDAARQHKVGVRSRTTSVARERVARDDGALIRDVGTGCDGPGQITRPIAGRSHAGVRMEW